MKNPTNPDPNNSADAANGILAIHYSLRCFTWSVFGIIPIFGIPMAIAAFSNFLKAREVSRDSWNPAQAYLIWGSALGSLGLLISLILALYLICAAMQLLPWQYQQQ